MSVSPAVTGEACGLNGLSTITLSIWPPAVPLSVPTLVEMVKVPEYAMTRGNSGAREIQPSVWSVTVPTALLPGYVALRGARAGKSPQAPVEETETVPVGDPARSARLAGF